MTIECINSILRYVKNIEYEIIVVDNNSEDESKELFFKNFEFNKDIKFIYLDKNLGYGGGNNVGERISVGEYLFFLNSDTLFFENSLELLFDVYNKQKKLKKIGFIQPRLYSNIEKNFVQKTNSTIPTLYNLLQENLPFFQKIFKQQFREFRYLDWDRNCSKYVDTVCGAAMFCERWFFEKIGAFDERFFLYFEEYDLCRRAVTLGYNNYYSVETSIIHLHNKSPSPNMSKKLLYINSFLKYVTKYVKI